MSYSHWYICVVSLCQFIVLSGSSMTTKLATRPGGYKLICIFCSFNKIKSNQTLPQSCVPKSNSKFLSLNLK